jgi:hypothetical protein
LIPAGALRIATTGALRIATTGALRIAATSVRCPAARRTTVGIAALSPVPANRIAAAGLDRRSIGSGTTNETKDSK